MEQLGVPRVISRPPRPTVKPPFNRPLWVKDMTSENEIKENIPPLEENEENEIEEINDDSGEEANSFLSKRKIFNADIFKEIFGDHILDTKEMEYSLYIYCIDASSFLPQTMSQAHHITSKLDAVAGTPISFPSGTAIPFFQLLNELFDIDFLPLLGRDLSSNPKEKDLALGYLPYEILFHLSNEHNFKMSLDHQTQLNENKIKNPDLDWEWCSATIDNFLSCLSQAFSAASSPSPVILGLFE
eukprot:TRINITY_DN10478_c0_g1_i1.p1 TRINITY_DN10478_c0_g1~~TRINITY_DN10478_c0_g1_i1.p1  ORF type:complete len:243 (+),score=45.96 TRINITY_DN10478_c0_g1_i1:69-797(+)